MNTSLHRVPIISLLFQPIIVVAITLWPVHPSRLARTEGIIMTLIKMNKL
uniref:Uncharacterized protein n=1 Tax=Pseudomonas syringae pv. actinidiae TaxID=103796 RepID=M1J6Q3_PSESF|nr:hypothetical protein [Pseudomonas syringae pv. actinidiae]